MTLHSSDIDNMLDIGSDSDSDLITEDSNGSGLEDNALLNSGTDNYKPFTKEFSADDCFTAKDNGSNRKSKRQFGPHGSVESLGLIPKESQPLVFRPEQLRDTPAFY